MAKKLLIVGVLAGVLSFLGLSDSARADHQRHRSGPRIGLSFGGYGYSPHHYGHHSHYDHHRRPSSGFSYYSPSFSLSIGRGYGGYGGYGGGYGGYGGGYGYGGGCR
jgi:hypothetical protein